MENIIFFKIFDSNSSNSLMVNGYMSTFFVGFFCCFFLVFFVFVFFPTIYFKGRQLSVLTNGFHAKRPPLNNVSTL